MENHIRRHDFRRLTVGLPQHEERILHSGGQSHARQFDLEWMQPRVQMNRRTNVRFLGEPNRGDNAIVNDDANLAPAKPPW